MAKKAIAKRVLLAWSSGKDSAWTLHMLRHDAGIEVVGLLTTFDEDRDCVGIHNVSRLQVEAQAAAAGLPIWPVPIPWPCPNTVYGQRLRAALTRARDDGVTHLAFGDLFLEDIRAYRESVLVGTGVSPLFPIWSARGTTAELARTMIDAGLRATITAVDTAVLSTDWIGCEYNRAFLDALPPAIDPCGENGEFHTFCYAGPMYARTVSME